ncbi:hypothetical protein RLOC_00004584 [Lonchura striata]|uniref:Uncharacterized protein n=1 Tax=Lonchura striata TaxID=40157 RepID=A0A218U973_9PASE|nr:hypothetical protein RLOC_00004584 [Lonchura striata domestica]
MSTRWRCCSGRSCPAARP